MAKLQSRLSPAAAAGDSAAQEAQQQEHEAAGNRGSVGKSSPAASSSPSPPTRSTGVTAEIAKRLAEGEDIGALALAAAPVLVRGLTGWLCGAGDLNGVSEEQNKAAKEAMDTYFEAKRARHPTNSQCSHIPTQKRLLPRTR